MKEPTPEHPITVTPNTKRVAVTADGILLADTRHALTLREGKYAAVQYIPLNDVKTGHLLRSLHHTYCPYKGDCSYYHLQLSTVCKQNAVWTYESPYPAVAAIAGHVAFYPDLVDIAELRD